MGPAWCCQAHNVDSIWAVMRADLWSWRPGFLPWARGARALDDQVPPPVFILQGVADGWVPIVEPSPRHVSALGAPCQLGAGEGVLSAAGGWCQVLVLPWAAWWAACCSLVFTGTGCWDSPQQRPAPTSTTYSG